MRTKYCCNTRQLTSYYTAQAGGAFPVYAGSRYQRGGGIGSFLGGIGRRILPFLAKGAKVLGKEALRSGINVAADALEGRNISDSIRERAAESKEVLREKAVRKLKEFGEQAGTGRKRKKRDIFDDVYYTPAQ